MRRFWSPEQSLFINNLPWLGEEGSPRMCDRSLATAILFDQCPHGQTDAALRVLAECPPEMGFSYPANAGWRLWALGKGGRADVIVKDFRERWANMESVLLNNTLQEDWHAKPDSGSEWSHCPVAPLYVTTMSLAGIKPLVPGFKRCEIRPQLADLEFARTDRAFRPRTHRIQQPGKARGGKLPGVRRGVGGGSARNSDAAPCGFRHSQGLRAITCPRGKPRCAWHSDVRGAFHRGSPESRFGVAPGTVV